jgi:hypothetical protein
MAISQGGGSAPPAVSEPSFFYSVNRQRVGPVPLSHLQRLANSGQLRPADMVLREGARAWVEAGTVAGLFPGGGMRPAAPPAVRPEPVQAPAPLLAEGAFNHEPQTHRRPTAAAAVSNTIIVQQPSSAAHSLGIAALVIGVLSFFVCWIPFLGIAVSGLGLLLGLGGLVLAIVRRGSGVGFSIAGSGLSALSLVICLIWTFALSSAFKAVDDAVAKQNRTNQSAVSDSNPDKAAPQNQGDASPPAPDKPPPTPTKSEPEWADASKGAIRQGDLQVKITKVTIGKVQLLDMAISAFKRSETNLLMVKLELLNANPTKKVEYHSWLGEGFSFDRDSATLKDNFNNSYKRICFNWDSYPVESVAGSKSIYPNKEVTDLLVFEVPVDTMEYLRLELPAKNFGGTGMLRLQIPKAMIQR